MQTAIVIGGGIAGSVTAVALRKAGFTPAVYEAYDRSADGVGAFLTLASNGIDALRAVGIAERVLTDSFQTPTMRFVSARGSVLAEMPLGSSEAATASRTIKRSSLYTALRDEAARAGVPIHYGKRLVDADETSDGVVASFADGTTATADLLVGADGLRSRTRTLIDPNAPAARYVGMLNVGGYAPGVEVPGEPGVMHMVFGRRCFFGYVLHPGGEVWWFANPTSPDEAHGRAMSAMPPHEWRKYLLDLFAGDDSPAVELINATPHLRTGWSTFDFPAVPRWHQNRMVIVGDAAHATSPSSGQGASQAIEDAVVLARCLRDVEPIPHALATFESLRRERVERVVEQGRRNGAFKTLGWFRRTVVLPVVFRLLTVKGDPQAWVTAHHIDWDAPVMPAPVA
jgi:2-polyprenyl-6-methoxyphenol hydroxylase-like FAD-dependent oxidoreductase